MSDTNFDNNKYYKDRARNRLHTVAVDFEQGLVEVVDNIKRTDMKDEDAKKMGKKVEEARKAIFAIDDFVYNLFKEKNAK